MNIAVFGTGMVGQAIAARLYELGNNVVLGTRDPGKTRQRTEKDRMGNSFAEWHASHPDISVLTFADAAKGASVIFNCTSGNASVDVLKLAGESNLNGKVLVDVANPLDFSQGMPPSLTPCNTDSLGEVLQRTFPKVKVVKTLNTMNAFLMVNPSLVPGDHHVFVSGNDAGAKATTSELLRSFGWKSANIIDLGDITTARGTEQLLPIWLRLWGALQTPMFNFHIVIAPQQKN